jgi:hypothetical protein
MLKLAAPDSLTLTPSTSGTGLPVSDAASNATARTEPSSAA